MKNRNTDSNNGNRSFEMRRRNFVKILGGGILFIFNPFAGMELFSSPDEQGRTLTKDYNAFLRIASDGTVTCYTGKIETRYNNLIAADDG